MVVICPNTYPSPSLYDAHFGGFPHALSAFQKHAIQALVDGNHSLVSAPTGSGKTLPAEFAIRHFADKGMKIIYTSPIKALSNQKYYEFSRKFPDLSVGLITGDIKANPDATVLIMTTEILMNHLTGGGGPGNGRTEFSIDIDTELACVVFDEVHYINDFARGQNWEKTILLLPPKVQMLMLSATLSNLHAFAEWCEVGRPSPVVVSETTKRAVPLTHYAFMASVEGAFKGLTDKALAKELRDNTNALIPLQSADGKFSDSGYCRVVKTLKCFQTRRVIIKRKHAINALAAHLKAADMLPALAFVFSRKKVEQFARDITTNLLEDDSKVPYTTRAECEAIVRRLPNFKEYLELPEYEFLVSLLEKGVGIHHSGMVPVLREIVELMIAQGRVKLLFATESFAIGLDCAIKTTIMTGLEKHDGTNFRLLYSHEYTQAAGRAGRRGRDTVGHVVHCSNMFETPSQTEYRLMLGGRPQALESKFRISYPMVLSRAAAGPASESDFLEFASRSMAKGETDRAMVALQDELCDISNRIAKHYAMVSEMGIADRGAACREYAALVGEREGAVNKKRKETEKAMDKLQNAYMPRCIENDARRMNAVWVLEDSADELCGQIESLSTGAASHVASICDILCSRGFLIISDEGAGEPMHSLSLSGRISERVSEMHPLIVADCLRAWNYFEDFSPKQIAVVLAALVELKIPEELRARTPSWGDRFVEERALELFNFAELYEKLEGTHCVATGIDYVGMVGFDAPALISEWWECQDERACKVFAQTRLADIDVSIGDFSKAVVKLSGAVREVAMLA